MHFLILHPQSADYLADGKKTNNLSCVLRIETAGASMLLPADIEADDEQALIARAAP